MKRFAEFNESTKFTSEKNKRGKSITVPKSELEKIIKTGDASSLVQKLNRSGYDLGSGHDGVEMVKVGPTTYRLRLTAFPGGPRFTINFDERRTQ